MSAEVALEIQTSPVEPLPTLKESDFVDGDETKPTSTKPANLQGKITKFKCLMGVSVVLLVLYFIIFFPIYLIYSLITGLFCGFDATKQEFKPHEKENEATSIYEKAMEMQRTARKVAEDLTFFRSRLAVLVLVWLILNLSIPGLRTKILFGSQLWKWTLLLVMLFGGYHATSLGTRFFLQLMSSCGTFKGKRNVKYFAQGLRVSANFVVLTWTILMTWIFYFKTSHGIKKTKDTHVILHIATWTFVTLALGAVLWLVKNAVLLVWEADAVYKRFEERILSAGFQLYFLGHICGWEKNNLEIFRPKRKQVPQNKIENQAQSNEAKNEVGDANEDAEKRNEEREEAKMRKARNTLRIERGKFYEGVTIYDLKQMTQYFMDLSKVSSREDDGSSDVLVNCKIINPSTTSRDITATDLKKFDLEEDDAKLLCWDLNIEHLLEDSEKISYENFEKSMVRAHKNCVALGHTLLDAIEVVKVLNKVITIVSIALGIIAWLLLTDIATNKILVLLASPFLAATFVFGDTCKKTFEGIIFSFISHPYDVGDLCIIDGIELEVKRMGILTTTFILIATKEEALYPNASLSTKSIINLKGEPDPNDSVELKLDCSKTNLVAVKDKISKFFKDDGGKRFEEATTNVEEIGSCIRLTIHYRNVMSIHEVTHSQCLDKKRKQRSECLFEMANFMNELN